MKQLADNLWIHDDVMSVLGTPIGLRMTVVKLADGKLWLHSPTRLSPELAAEISALGEVGYLVEASNGHNLYLVPWLEAFPGAAVYVSAGIPAKLRRSSGLILLDKGFENIWSADLDWQYLDGVDFFNESLFLHRSSRSLIVTDLIQHHRYPEPTFLQQYVFPLIGFKDACIAPPLRLPFFYRDRTAFCDAVRAARAWEFERIIVTHGDVIEEHAGEVFAELTRQFA